MAFTILDMVTSFFLMITTFSQKTHVSGQKIADVFYNMLSS